MNEKDGVRKLLEEYGVKLAMVTLGPKGAYLKNEHAAVHVPCPPVKPVDTTGAGDIFGGSAVSRILKRSKAPEELSEEELREIAVFAVSAASLSTQVLGGIPSIPGESEVYEIISKFFGS